VTSASGRSKSTQGGQGDQHARKEGRGGSSGKHTAGSDDTVRAADETISVILPRSLERHDEEKESLQVVELDDVWMWISLEGANDPVSTNGAISPVLPFPFPFPVSVSVKSVRAKR
jgi:hypothetical protein